MSGSRWVEPVGSCHQDVWRIAAGCLGDDGTIHDNKTDASFIRLSAHLRAPIDYQGSPLCP